MLIVRKSPITDKVHQWDINVTESQLRRWNDGELIQNVMPDLTADQREFIKTGITPEEWNEMFGEDYS